MKQARWQLRINMKIIKKVLQKCEHGLSVKDNFEFCEYIPKVSYFLQMNDCVVVITLMIK